MKIGTDKIKHAGACGATALGASALLALAGAGWVAVALGGFMAGLAIGIGKEYGDHCAAGNRWDWADIIADAAGAAMGAVAVGAMVALI